MNKKGKFNMTHPQCLTKRLQGKQGLKISFWFYFWILWILRATEVKGTLLTSILQVIISTLYCWALSMSQNTVLGSSHSWSQFLQWSYKWFRFYRSRNWASWRLSIELKFQLYAVWLQGSCFFYIGTLPPYT